MTEPSRGWLGEELAVGDLLRGVVAFVPVRFVAGWGLRFACIESTPFGAGPRGVAAPPGPLSRTAATIALTTRRSQPETPRIESDPRLSPRFQALVPEMERDHRRSTPIPCARKLATCSDFWRWS
jgi:hypothetical protein